MPTIEHVERWFKEGMAQAEIDDPQTSRCPYPEDTTASHWWTRGYAYVYRNLRALRAEAETERLREVNRRLVTLMASKIIEAEGE